MIDCYDHLVIAKLKEKAQSQMQTNNRFKMQGKKKLNKMQVELKGYDDGATKFMEFVHCPEFRITRKNNALETGSVSVLRWDH
jgi:hypothetical protein